MRKQTLALTALLATLAVPIGAQAQGVIGGAAEGAAVGGAAAGPVGAAVGAGVGAATGGVRGVFGIDERPRFREYVVREHVPSYRVRKTVRVGTTLPRTGVRYYAVPRDFNVGSAYRYTVIDDRPVIVDRSYRVVDIID